MEEDKKTEIQLEIIESLNSFLDYFLAAIILFAVVCAWWSYKSSSREEDSPPQETMNPELIKEVGSSQNIHLEDGGYVIELEPLEDLGLAYYYCQPHADGRPLKIISGDQTIQSGDGSCYCYMNGEPIATLEDLADRWDLLRNRLYLMSVVTPEDLDRYDRYWDIMVTKGSPEANRVFSEELGMSEDDVVSYMRNIFYLQRGHHEPLSPELFQKEIFTPALTYHPGTDGCNISAGYATAMITYFISDYHIHLEEQDYINQLMIDATALLTEDEKAQLREGMPDLIALEDETIATYPANRSIYEECGNYELTDLAIDIPGYKDDWAKTRAALVAAGFPAEITTT